MSVHSVLGCVLLHRFVCDEANLTLKTAHHMAFLSTIIFCQYVELVTTRSCLTWVMSVGMRKKANHLRWLMWISM